MFYKKKKETKKKKEENKSHADSSTMTMELQVKGEDEVCPKERDVLVLDVELLEELSLQMENILQDSTKIISEVLLPPPPQPRTRPSVPGLVEVEAMERPLEASYQASVPVVQVQQ